MDKPIYSVYALVNGKSSEVCNATDSLSDAKSFAKAYYVEHGSNVPVKVVESKVVHDVVFGLEPESFHVSICIPTSGKILHYYDESEFICSLRSLIRNHVHINIIAHAG